MVVISSPSVFSQQVCCRQTDYWQFVKDIRWLSPHSALHVENELEKANVYTRKTYFLFFENPF